MTLNNFQLRTISGAAYVAIVVVALMWGFYGQFILTAVISLLSMRELLRMQQADSSVNLIFGSALNLIILSMHPQIPDMLGLVWTADEFVKLMIAQGMLLVLILSGLHLFHSGTDIYQKLSPVFFGFIYISVPCLLFLRITQENYDFRLPLLVFILTWCSDTFAYLVGRAMGKKKLYEALSPKKTMEGFVGGVLLTSAAGGLLGYLWNFGIAGTAIAGALVSVAGTAGDLFESALKRKAGIKDSGNVLPGHGGALDRFDAFFFACVVVYSWQVLFNL